MPIWKLEPDDLTADHWRCSKWVGTLFIRAKDELTARKMADSAFAITPELVPGTETPLIPWDYEWVSTCEQVGDSEYDEDGPDDILGPEEAIKRAHPRPW